MSRVHDAIVLGVGGMGSAALSHLAQRGCQVLGIERYDVPHAMGSSHGVTRIIRKSYFEHPSYVPLLHRAYDLWRELETCAGEQLLWTTGSLDIGQTGSTVVSGSTLACTLHNLPHEKLSAQQLLARYPMYDVPSDFEAVYQPEGGFLLSEACISAHCFRALADGAELHGREQVKGWKSAGDLIKVTTDRGEYQTKKLIVTAGAWTSHLLPEYAELAVAERQVLGWFQPLAPDLFDPVHFPVFLFNTPDDSVFYGFPVHGVPGFKIGRMHHLNEQTNPDTINREVTARDEALLRTFVETYLPKAAGPTLSLKTCMFTNTPDEHFIIERHPRNANIVVACGFSGHGFKFASVVGEILTDLVLTGETRYDLSGFSSRRFEDKYVCSNSDSNACRAKGI